VGSVDGYELLLRTFDADGYAEPDVAFIQLKASESLSVVGSAYVFDFDVRDYNLWMLEDMPVILILFDASRRRAYWLAVQRYFREDSDRGRKKGAKTVRVPVPRRQTVSGRASRQIRGVIQGLRQPTLGVKS